MTGVRCQTTEKQDSMPTERRINHTQSRSKTRTVENPDAPRTPAPAGGPEPEAPPSDFIRPIHNVKKQDVKKQDVKKQDVKKQMTDVRNQGSINKP